MSSLEDYLQCGLCTAPEIFSATSLQANVASSEREFEKERFTVWQCNNCKCIHALEGVDLGHYYSQYGLHEQSEPDPIVRFFFGGKLNWLEKAGMRSDQPVLDFGCGGGQFLRFLQAKGYAKAVGYDPFTQDYADTKRLEQRYALVMSSDVIEHDISAIRHLETLIGLTAEHGLIYIETPDALSINLAEPAKHRQILQQPFHRHILTRTWIIKQMQLRGWEVAQMLRQPFFHSWIPFLNVPAMDHYWDKYGGLSTISEGYRWSAFLSPRYWFLGLFGALLYSNDEVQLVFRRKSN